MGTYVSLTPEKKALLDVQVNTINEIKSLLKTIEELAIKDVTKATNCGAFSEDSNFLKENNLLAKALIESKLHIISINSTKDKKEAKNLSYFI